MGKRTHLFALLCYLLIPVAMIGGVAVAHQVDPEAAAGTSNYVLYFHVLTLVKNALLLATMGACALLGLLCVYFLWRSTQRAGGWLALAALGPFGIVGLAMLGERAPSEENLYGRFVQRLHWALRVVYEGTLFVAAWTVAYQAMVAKRDVMIQVQAWRRGVPVQDIIDEQNASSGMWAFGEGLEVMFLVPLLYLLLPVVFNAIGRLAGLSSAPASRIPPPSVP